MNCPNCGRVIYGFWKYPVSLACSWKCFRRLIAEGKIPRITPERSYEELGISAPNKKEENS
jgi:hypothetical protein